jgi:divalent metal cation (Fe/Co/Zn/Cd) transporter
MDRALPTAEQQVIRQVLADFERSGVQFHVLRTRVAGRRAFISVHLLMPGAWSVKRGHDLAEDVEHALHRRLPYATVFTHLEPLEDPRSFEDTTLDRQYPSADTAHPPVAEATPKQAPSHE